MSNGFPTSSRCSSVDFTQGPLLAPSPRVGSRLLNGLPPNLPLDGPTRPPTLPSQIGNPDQLLRKFPPPPPSAQDAGNPPTLHPLDASLHPAFICPLHEASKIHEAPKEEQVLPTSPQLPPDSHRFSAFSFNLSPPPKHPFRVHARCSDVLPTRTDPSSVSPSSAVDQPLLLSCDPTRIPLHPPLPHARPLHLHPERSNPPLHPRGTLRRFIQPAHNSPLLAENQLHPLPKSQPLHHNSGILGTSPFHTDTKRSPPPRSEAASSQSSSILPLPRPGNRPGVLPGPKVRGAPSSNLPLPTPQAPPRARERLQRSLHLHASRQNAPRLRPRRLRSDPIQQTRTQVGHPQCVGQPTNLRAAQLPSPTKRGVPRSPQPTPENEAVLLTALAPPRRHSRSWPLLPFPPSSLPEVVFASSKGKVHLRLSTQPPSSPQTSSSPPPPSPRTDASGIQTPLASPPSKRKEKSLPHPSHQPPSHSKRNLRRHSALPLLLPIHPTKTTQPHPAVPQPTAGPTPHPPPTKKIPLHPPKSQERHPSPPPDVFHDCQPSSPTSHVVGYRRLLGSGISLPFKLAFWRRRSPNPARHLPPPPPPRKLHSELDSNSLSRSSSFSLSPLCSLPPSPSPSEQLPTVSAPPTPSPIPATPLPGSRHPSPIRPTNPRRTTPCSSNHRTQTREFQPKQPQPKLLGRFKPPTEEFLQRQSPRSQQTYAYLLKYYTPQPQPPSPIRIDSLTLSERWAAELFRSPSPSRSYQHHPFSSP
ncbi:Overlapping protein/movement protein [Kennedya yellow mosaic virus]|uniref:Movement protein n=1 Tax=Kennedya yellow mosaic virus (strain Jervis bay) TaxID=36392 RepID=O56971_KYMVJ|nr:Overlapping protein/movement protein [Kennedya yellow mosaic virus]BAA00531.1 unnamed protein product [Kennedya yellow mosaic virus]